jgi:hypothetical protein
MNEIIIQTQNSQLFSNVKHYVKYGISFHSIPVWLNPYPIQVSQITIRSENHSNKRLLKIFLKELEKHPSNKITYLFM